MILIGISGKKQSGKSSLAYYIQSWYWCKMQSITDGFKQDSYGGIVWSAAAQAALANECQQADPGLPEHFCKDISFADVLKEKVCMDVLGLSYKQCYGTDEHKNAPTDYLWDNLSMDIRIAYSTEEEEYGIDDIHVFKVPRSGPLTARELMQVVGTNIFRNQFSEMVWVNAAMHMVEKLSTDIVIIPDIRFGSEVDAIAQKDGYFIRLERKVEDDAHESETALDDYDFEKFGDRCLILDNASMTMEEKNAAAVKFVEAILLKQRT